MAYFSYTRKLTNEELQKIGQTHEYKRITREEFLQMLAMVSRNSQGEIVVDAEWVARFLWRLGRVRTHVDVFAYDLLPDGQVVLKPFPPGPMDHVLVIEAMRFPDGQITGHLAEGEFALIAPKL